MMRVFNFWHLLHLTLVRLVFVHIVLDVQQVEGHRLTTYAINGGHRNQASRYFASNHLESELMEKGAGRVEASVQNQQLALCLFRALKIDWVKSESMTMSFHLFQGLPFWGRAMQDAVW